MKKVIYKLVHLLIIVLAHLLISSSIFAQAPQKMSYQAIIRNSNDSLLISTPVGMRISLVQGSPSGIVVFSETQTATTNDNGLVSLQIGMGTAVSGTFASINWAAGPYYVKTETDLNGGINYTIISSNELLSVPYALFSATGPPGATGPQGPQGITGTNGNDGSIGPQGLNGLTALIKTTTEPSGANCATGGTKIETGLDANNNGVLDIAEVNASQTTFVCNGLGGAISNGNSQGQMLFWNGTTWVNLNLGNNGQRLTVCNNQPTWTTGGICPSVSSISCASASASSILVLNQSVNTMTVAIPYVNGNGGNYIGQIIYSTGVLGITASLASGLLAAGNGNLTFTLNGIPSSLGNALFNFNFLGHNCTFSLIVQSVGTLSNLDCNSATLTGLSCVAANSSLSLSIPYTGGNGGVISQQSIASDSVLGLTATIAQSLLNNGSGNITAVITGTPLQSGVALFNFSVGGQTCTFSLNVSSEPCIGSLYQGGVIAFLLQPGDGGYDPNVPHGFIAAPSDQGVSQFTGNCYGQCNSGGNNINSNWQDGLHNTNQWALCCNGAPTSCYNLILNDYSDWYLPAVNQLQIMYTNRLLIGGFQNDWYWTSSFDNYTGGWYSTSYAVNFINGSLNTFYNLNNYLRIRAIRNF
jgi:hypothetical protein